MEQETKFCPYCGEEIMAVAKKCKHCGEWLETQEQTDAEEEVMPIDSLTDEFEEEEYEPIGGNISRYAGILKWVVILVTIIGAIQNMPGTDRSAFRFRSRRSAFNDFLVDFANFIPDQIVNILDGVAVVGLIVLLLRFTKILDKPTDMLMNVLCISAAALYGLVTICDLIDLDVLSIMAVPMYLLFYIVLLVLGIKLLLTYKGALSSLGIGMTIWGIFSVLLFVFEMLAIFVTGDEDAYYGAIFAGAIMDVTFYSVFGSCIAAACERPSDEHNWNWVLAAVGAVGGFAIGFIIMFM